MTSMDERLKVLKMVQEGKLTAEEAAGIIEALSESAGPGRPPRVEPPVPPMPGRGGRWLRVRITDTNTGKTRVNVRMPMSVVQAGIKMGARFSPEIEGLDLAQLTEVMQSGELGQIVDVMDEDDGEHVEVFVE